MSINRTTNSGVAEYWARNEKARSNNGNFTTDGARLFSYSTVIGFTSEEGKKVVLDYTASTGNFLSMTTSTKHLPPAKGVCDVVLNPTHFQNTDKNFE
tara:strand:- start:739 stop:1032 length:294 start_codon:yes stop_codon:yes gene_type:complete